MKTLIPPNKKNGKSKPFYNLSSENKLKKIDEIFGEFDKLYSKNHINFSEIELDKIRGRG